MTESKQEVLEPRKPTVGCPWCPKVPLGDIEIAEWYPGQKVSFWVVQCPSCDCRGPEGESGDAAVELWDRRADLLPQPQIPDKRLAEIREQQERDSKRFDAGGHHFGRADIRKMLNAIDYLLLQQPVTSERCGECGHDKVGLSGFCIQQMPDAYGDLRGGHLCGHKCVYPATGAPKQPLPAEFICIAPNERSAVIRHVITGAEDELAICHLSLCLHCQEIAGMIRVATTGAGMERVPLVDAILPIVYKTAKEPCCHYAKGCAENQPDHSFWCGPCEARGMKATIESDAETVARYCLSPATVAEGEQQNAELRELDKVLAEARLNDPIGVRLTELALEQMDNDAPAPAPVQPPAAPRDEIRIVGNELRDAVRTMLSNVKMGDEGRLLIGLEDFNRLSELARQPRGARPLIDQPDKD